MLDIQLCYSREAGLLQTSPRTLLTLSLDLPDSRFGLRVALVLHHLIPDI